MRVAGNRFVDSSNTMYLLLLKKKDEPSLPNFIVTCMRELHELILIKGDRFAYATFTRYPSYPGSNYTLRSYEGNDDDEDPDFIATNISRIHDEYHRSGNRVNGNYFDFYHNLPRELRICESMDWNLTQYGSIVEWLDTTLCYMPSHGAGFTKRMLPSGKWAEGSVHPDTGVWTMTPDSLQCIVRQHLDKHQSQALREHSDTQLLRYYSDKMMVNSKSLSLSLHLFWNYCIYQAACIVHV